MADVHGVLQAGQAAVSDVLAAAGRPGSDLVAPRGPGQWSTSQIIEHLARTLEESAHVVDGAPSKFPKLPGFLRPVARAMVLRRVLRTKAFPRAKTFKVFDPAKVPDPTAGPATLADARTRLEGAFDAFARACRAAADRGKPIKSSVFGAVSVEDYAEFQELHLRHHRQQIGPA